jgi:membrane fusion protein (multidrug efflux system)
MTEPVISTQAPATPDPKQSVGSTPETRRKRKLAIIILGSIFLILGLIWLIDWFIWGRFEVYTDDAYVNGNIVQLMPQVPGTVVAINTDVPYLVLEGQPMIKLDPTDMEIALDHAKSALALTVREVRQSFERAREAQASMMLRNADLMKAKLDLKRRIGLVREKAISREELHHYQTAVNVAQAQYSYSLHHLQSALSVIENAHLYTHPSVERAKATLRKAYLNVVRTIIYAPVTGYVAKRSVQVGQQVNVDTPMLAIVPFNEVWVEANYKESQLSPLRMGQPVTLYADAYENVTYHGKIIGLTPGTGAAFSLLPPQNATGNWIKIVQRLAVRVALDQNELKKYPLQIGLSMRVTTNIYGKNDRRLAGTEKQIPVYKTTIFTQQLAKANALIKQILVENSPDMFIPPMHIQKGAS